MNPDQWNTLPSKYATYRGAMKHSTDRFFSCECRFGTFKLRSALENAFLLEAHNCAAITWLEYETIRIPLKTLTPTGRQQVYIPDFLINGEHLIECKARKAQKDPRVRAKAAAAEEYCARRDGLYHMLDFDQFEEFFELLS